MTISLIQPIPAGQAVRLILSPPRRAAAVKVLRRTTDTISGPDDAGAVLVADWADFNSVVDTDGLVDGIEFFYRVFYRDRDGVLLGAEHQPPSASCIPATTAVDASAPYFDLIRQRLQAGLDHAVATGRLMPPDGRIRVVTAPFLDPAKDPLPRVSIHLDSDQDSSRFLGDHVALSEGEPIEDDDGWLSRVSMTVLGTSLNTDERIELGKVLKHIIAANMEIWGANGLSQVSFTLSHSELVPESFNAPLYVAAGSLSFFAPTISRSELDPLESVEVTVTAMQEHCE